MPFIPSLLFGISSSLDALLVGISLGLRKIRIRFWQNLFISLVTLSGTCLSVGLGGKLTPLLPDPLAVYAGSLVLILLGVYYITKWILKLLQQHRENTSGNEMTQASHAGKPPSLHIAEVFTLSFTLSVNNMGMGLAASIAGLPLLPAAAATALCSILFLFLGNRLGKSHLLLFIGDLADPISGALLIGLGLLQLF
ncbi:MAG: manganese efflux pump [Acetatifactor sp.]